MTKNDVDKSIIQSITRLVRYVSKELRADFELAAPDERRDHLLTHARDVGDWLGRIQHECQHNAELEFTPAVVSAIEAVLDHWLIEERNHFKGCVPESRSNHIYLHLRQLKSWLRQRRLSASSLPGARRLPARL